MNKPFASYLIQDHSIFVLKVLEDNFVYLVCCNGKAILIDAGDAKPILKFLQSKELDLLHILITHTHQDHIAGCLDIQNELGVLSRSPASAEEVVNWLDTPCRVISTPGHTKIHKSFYFPELNIIFTGDVLINGGCGRLLGGTIDQLFNSLRKIASLPNSVRIFGGHDYLKENLRFAQQELPSCKRISERIKRYQKNKPDGLFVLLEDEKKTNPFMRCSSIKELSVLRTRKDHF